MSMKTVKWQGNGGIIEVAWQVVQASIIIDSNNNTEICSKIIIIMWKSMSNIEKFVCNSSKLS